MIEQVLSPRQDIGIYSSGKNKKKKAKDSGQGGKDSDNNNIIDVKTEGETRDPAAIVSLSSVHQSLGGDWECGKGSVIVKCSVLVFNCSFLMVVGQRMKIYI